MAKFKLYEDILSRSWNRYFYDVEADTVEEAAEKVKTWEVPCCDYIQIHDCNDELEPEENYGNPTRKIYSDKKGLIWHNAELVNRPEIITQSLRIVFENLLLIMESEPEVFIGTIAPSVIIKVMKRLSWKLYNAENSALTAKMDYWFYFIKDDRDFNYRVSGNIYSGNIKVEKCEKHYGLQN